MLLQRKPVQASTNTTKHNNNTSINANNNNNTIDEYITSGDQAIQLQPVNIPTPSAPDLPITSSSNNNDIITANYLQSNAFSPRSDQPYLQLQESVNNTTPANPFIVKQSKLPVESTLRNRKAPNTYVTQNIDSEISDNEISSSETDRLITATPKPQQVLSIAPKSMDLPVKALLNEQFYLNEKYPSVTFIRHIVTGESDLTDLAVNYGCSVHDIRKHNRRVVFDYLDNILGEYIHIPVHPNYVGNIDKSNMEIDIKKQETLEEQAKRNRQYFAIKSFMQLALHRVNGHNNSITEEEAEYYLEDNKWDVTAALSKYQEDLDWELANIHKAPHMATNNKTKMESKRGIDNSSSESKTNASLLTNKPRQNQTQSILSMAATRQAKLSALVQEEEKRLAKLKEEERIRQRDEAEKQQRRQAVLAAQQIANQANTNRIIENQPVNTRSFNGSKYTAVADSDGFYAIPPTNYSQTVEPPQEIQMQDMTSNSNTSINTKQTQAKLAANNNTYHNVRSNNNNDECSTICWPKSTKPTPVAQQIAVSESSFI